MQLKTIIITAALLAGCGHTSATGPDHAKAAGPDRLEATGPQVASHESLHRLEALSHTMVTPAELRVCVAPNGTAADVELIRSSGSAWFDNAAIAELKSSRYRPFVAPEPIRVCGPVRIEVR